MELNGYLYEAEERRNASNGMWCPAEKNNERYFLKQFRFPRLPRKGCAPSVFQSKTKECRDWYDYRRELIGRLRELGDGRGNIVIPQELFENKGCYYQTTFWIDITTDSLDDVKNYTEKEKVMLLKTYAAALKKVHSKGIVHGDLKPDNVLIGRSSTNQPVSKLIDFDDSYFACRPLSPELIVATDAYWSPELAAYKCGHSEYAERLTCASDVFTTAIVFHQFWTGVMPTFKTEMLYQTVAAGEDVKLDPSLPLWLHNLLMAMLEQNPEDRPAMEDVHMAIQQEKFDVTDTLENLLEMANSRMKLYSDENQATLKKSVSKARRVLSNPVYEKVNAVSAELYTLLTTLPAQEPPKEEPEKPEKKTAKDKPVPEIVVKKDPPAAVYPDCEGGTSDPSVLLHLLRKIPTEDWYYAFYTEESAEALKEAFRYVALGNRLYYLPQATLDEYTKSLGDALLRLQTRHGFEPYLPLPDGYIRVELISATKIRAVREGGIGMTLPVSAAGGMGLIRYR